MDDLIAYLRQLLMSDVPIRALFSLYGSAVIVRAPSGESPEEFPSFTLTGAPGAGMPQGEGGFFTATGAVSLITVARDTDTKAAVETMWPLVNRAIYLISGDGKPGEPEGGIINVRLPSINPLTGAASDPVWAVSQCRTVLPNGPLSDPDPLVARHKTTFKVELFRV